MPVLEHKGGGRAVFSTAAEVEAALASGEWVMPAGVPLQYTDEKGTTFEGTPEQLKYKGPGNLDPGANQLPASVGATEKRAWSGGADKLKAFTEGAGSVLTFGASDALGEALGSDVKEREQHTPGRGAGEVAGVIASMAIPFAGEASLAAKAAKFIPSLAVSRAVAGGATAGGRVLGALGEGALYGAGNVISDIALSDPGFSAEAIAARGGEVLHGALLGGALGFAGGAVGEGIGKAVSAVRARSARTPVAAFDTEVGKEVINDLVGAHKTFTNVAGEVENLSAKASVDFEAGLSKQASELHASRSSLLRKGAEEANQALIASSAKFSDETANELRLFQQAAHENPKAAINKYNELAPFVGLPRVKNSLAKEPEAVMAAIDDLLGAQHSGIPDGLTKAYKKALTGNDKAVVNYLNKVSEHAAESKIADLSETVLQHLKQFDESAKHVDDFVAKSREQLGPKAPKFNHEMGREALGLLSKDKITPEAMRRFLASSDLLERTQKLGSYYNEVIAAAKDNPVAKMQLDDALAKFANANDKLLTGEAKAALTDPVMASMLGIEALNEVSDLPEPVKNILRVAAIYKGMKFLGKAKVGAGGWMRKIARSMARRSAVAVGANMGYRGALGDMAEGVLGGFGRPIAAGMAATAAGEAVGAVGRKFGAVKAAVDDVNAVKQHISESVIDGLGKGKPPRGKIRVLPGVHKVLDKMIGDPQASKGKTEQEKFAIVQDRLAQFAASPQSALDGIYHALKPVQQASELVADQMETAIGKQLEYAYETMPKDPGTMISFGKSMWKPTDRQLYEWGYHLSGSLFPLEVIDAITSGAVPPQAVECLASTNPAIFNHFVKAVMENSEAIRENATYDQKIALGLALKMPLEPTTDPQYVAFIQNVHLEKTMADIAGPTKETSSAEDSYSDAQKLLS